MSRGIKFCLIELIKKCRRRLTEETGVAYGKTHHIYALNIYLVILFASE